jgi:hypothetical protein
LAGEDDLMPRAQREDNNGNPQTIPPVEHETGHACATVPALHPSRFPLLF